MTPPVEDLNKREIVPCKVADLDGIDKNAPTLTGQPKPTKWSGEEYEKFLNELKKFKRSTLETAPAHALVFLGWYTGKRNIEAKDVLKTLHGILSAVVVNKKKLIPDTVCDTATDNAAIATDYVSQAPAEWKFINRNGISTDTYAGAQAGRFPITSNQCLEWINWLVKLLTVDPSTAEPLLAAAKERQMLGLTYVAFMAMNTIRLITKEPYSVSEHIQQTFIDRVTNLLVNWLETLQLIVLFVLPIINFSLTCLQRSGKELPLESLLQPS